MSLLRKWFFLTTLFFFLLGSLGHGVLSTFRSDGFSENVLQNLTNFDVDAVAHSVVTLNDSSVIITGVVRYPPEVTTHPSFTDEDDIKSADNATDTHRFAGLVLRVLTNGSVAWAKRTVLCSFETTFTAVYDGTHVYVAGGTAGVPAEDGRLVDGRVLIRYNLNGTQERLAVHGGDGERYTFIALTNAEPDTLFLISCAPSEVAIYQNLREKAPTENGLLVSRIRKRDMEVVQTEIVSDSTSVEGELVRDNFWDMAVSHDGRSIYVAAYRETMRFGFTNFPAVFTINGGNLSMAHTRNMENELQLDMHIATNSVSDNVYVAYVDRTANKEFVVVQRLTRGLAGTAWGEGLGSTFRYRILLESEFIRETASSVRGVSVDDNGTVRVLVHSAEVVNATLGAEAPVPSLAIHRQLNNGRPAFVVVSKEQVVQVVQAQTEQRWEPFGMAIGKKEDVIVGADRGLVNGGVSRLLLTGVVNRHAVSSPGASPSPRASATASAGPGAGSGGAGSEGAGEECIGVSTRIGGQGIREIVAADARLRLQMHPGRWGMRVGVWCHEWNNGTADVLCATGDHVVRHWGRMLYMKEFCAAVGCVKRVEEVVNFKGGCGDEVVAHDALSVTMHAGGSYAASAMRNECDRMERWTSRLWWWITSL